MLLVPVTVNVAPEKLPCSSSGGLRGFSPHSINSTLLMDGYLNKLRHYKHPDNVDLTVLSIYSVLIE